jgi:hypothetical protein
MCRLPHRALLPAKHSKPPVPWQLSSVRTTPGKRPTTPLSARLAASLQLREHLLQRLEGPQGHSHPGVGREGRSEGRHPVAACCRRPQDSVGQARRRTRSLQQHAAAPLDVRRGRAEGG